MIVGIDPADGQFFVATKGFFNKKPVMYKTVDELNTIPKEGLRRVMYATYIAMCRMKFDGIYQGDLLFGPNDEDVTDDGVITWFGTNVLRYGTDIEWQRDLIGNAIVGVAWHTRYVGDSISTLTRSDDLKFEALEVDNLIYSINAQVLKPSCHSEESIKHTLPHIEEFIGICYPVTVPDKYVVILKRAFAKSMTDFDIEYLLTNVFSEAMTASSKEIAKLKTEAAKDAVAERFDEFVAWVYQNVEPLEYMYDEYWGAATLKNWIVHFLDTRTPYPAFIAKEDGKLKPCPGEGFVYNHNGELVKLVDRNFFTVANRLNSPNRRLTDAD